MLLVLKFFSNLVEIIHFISPLGLMKELYKVY
nr:MAG TPA: hypothetical protein [Caudoviricetes sp.]